MSLGVVTVTEHRVITYIHAPYASLLPKVNSMLSGSDQASYMDTNVYCREFWPWVLSISRSLGRRRL